MVIRHYNPDYLPKIEPLSENCPDPNLIQVVRQAISELPQTNREILEARIYEGLSFREIGVRQKIPRKLAYSEYVAALAILKIHLSEFARQRWNLKIDGICRICTHNKRDEIERLLQNKRKNESWGRFCRRLEQNIGEFFHPPQILINHLRHIRPSGSEGCNEK